jgi:nucleoside-diphosphate-sugar epimerase
MKRIVVTGGSGFIGANLVRRLVGDGHAVHLLVPPGPTRWRLEGLAGAVRLHEADLVDAAQVAAAVGRIRPEWVFHLAAHGAYSWETDLGRMVETNVVGTMHLMQACLATGFEAFVNTGSSSEYGFKDHAPAESEALDPNSYYAVNKTWATHFCRYTAVSRSLPITTLRLYSVYGPWEEPRRLMPTLICRGLAGALPPLVGPETARDYVYVDDVVDAYVLAASRPTTSGAVYNVGSGVQTTLRDVVEMARRVLGITVEPRWGSMPARIWDTSVWVADRRAIRAALGWEPRYDFAAGFGYMVAWFRADPARAALYQALVAAPG